MLFTHWLPVYSRFRHHRPFCSRPQLILFICLLFCPFAARNLLNCAYVVCLSANLDCSFLTGSNLLLSLFNQLPDDIVRPPASAKCDEKRQPEKQSHIVRASSPFSLLESGHPRERPTTVAGSFIKLLIVLPSCHRPWFGIFADKRH